MVPRQRFLQNHARIALLAGLAFWKYLEPEVSHFVYGAVSRSNQLWRIIGIGNVVAGVVVSVAHDDCGAAWKRFGFSEAEHGLPVQVPARNVYQFFLGVVRETGDCEHIAAKIMRVRI